MTKFTRIKKLSTVTYQWRGHLFSSKYLGRRRSVSGVWYYRFQLPEGVQELPANQCQLVFYGAE